MSYLALSVAPIARVEARSKEPTQIGWQMNGKSRWMFTDRRHIARCRLLTRIRRLIKKNIGLLFLFILQSAANIVDLSDTFDLDKYGRVLPWHQRRK